MKYGKQTFEAADRAPLLDRSDVYDLYISDRVEERARDAVSRLAEGLIS